MSEKKVRTREPNDRRLLVCTVIKYLLPMLFAIASYRLTQSKSQVVYGLADVMIVMFLSDWLIRKNKRFYILNSVLMLVLNIELCVLYFSGSFVTLVMLQSLTSVEDLHGKAVPYIIALILVLVFSFLPIRPVDFRKIKSAELLAAVLALELVLNVAAFENRSVLRGVYGIYDQYNEMQELRANSENTGEDKITKDIFYRDKIGNYYAKSQNLPDEPNIVLIFTEGLSQNIIDDARDIMPNVRQVQSESLNFGNYFNHTFATYRSLSGQLYSGYQLDDTDHNALTSIQEVLKGRGYRTEFINVEPENEMFTEYLNDLGFDEVAEDREHLSLKGSMTDKEAYEFLYDEMMEMSEGDSPFFLTIYTFNTHVSLNSKEEQFGDGRDKVLNRFYNADCQFKEFFDKFTDSELFDNTILVFTSDHAAYAEEDFIKAFPDWQRACLDVDSIPFFIYHKGVEVTTLDAAGRNSLDMAPTVLDYLDVDTPNYFLGDSLFKEKTDSNVLQTTFFDPAFWKSTDNGVIADLTVEQQQVVFPKVSNYFAVKKGEN